MSSEIFYDKAFIRIEDRFIPIVNHGSSNCFDISLRGREIPEKHWSVLNANHPESQLFTSEELREIAAFYEKVSMENRGGTRKSRYRSFEEGEFGRWILAGIKSAHTVEEYAEYGNTVTVVDYTESNWCRYCVATTEALLLKLEELKGRIISVSFWDDRHVTHPPMKRKRRPTDYRVLPKFYVLKATSGYFVKRSSRRIWFTKQKPTGISSERKFKTERAAQKYLEDNREFFSGHIFEVECVENGGLA